MEIHEKILFKKAKKKWGFANQLDMVCEELAELQIEVFKIKRGRHGGDLSKLAEEMADVSIMLDQLYTEYGDNFATVVELIREKKIARLKERIERA